MTTQQFFLVQPDIVPDIWYEVKPLIDKVLTLDHFSSMTSTDALRMILNSRQQLWVGVEDDSIFTAVLTELTNYPRNKALRVITWSTVTGYGYDNWITLIVDTLKQFGNDNECSVLEAWCRKGLAKKLNWEQQAIVVTTSIKPKQQQQRKRRRRTKSNG
jgi:hypothetical protein